MLDLLLRVHVLAVGLDISLLNVRCYSWVILFKNLRFIRGWRSHALNLVLIRSVYVIISRALIKAGTAYTDA